MLDGAAHLAAALPDWLDGVLCGEYAFAYALVANITHNPMCSARRLVSDALIRYQGATIWFCKPDFPYTLCIMYDKLLKNKES